MGACAKVTQPGRTSGLRRVSAWSPLSYSQERGTAEMAPWPKGMRIGYTGPRMLIRS